MLLYQRKIWFVIIYIWIQLYELWKRCNDFDDFRHDSTIIISFKSRETFLLKSNLDHTFRDQSYKVFYPNAIYVSAIHRWVLRIGFNIPTACCTDLNVIITILAELGLARRSRIPCIFFIFLNLPIVVLGIDEFRNEII